MDEQITTRDVAADEPCMCGKRTLRRRVGSARFAAREEGDEVDHAGDSHVRLEVPHLPEG